MIHILNDLETSQASDTDFQLPVSVSMEFACYILAGSADCSERTFELLGNSPCPRVRRRLAENRAVPVAVLIKLAADAEADVRSAVADNPGTPLALLCVLADDESNDVRYELAENPCLPVSILQNLCNDSNPYVAHRAMVTLDRCRKAQEPFTCVEFPNIRERKVRSS